MPVTITTLDGEKQHGMLQGIGDAGGRTRLSIATFIMGDGAGGKSFSGYILDAAEVADIRRQSSMWHFPEHQYFTYQRAAFELPEDRGVTAALLQLIDESFFRISADLSALSDLDRTYNPEFAPVELVIGPDHTSHSATLSSGLTAWRYRSWWLAAQNGFDARRSAETLASVVDGKPLMGLIIDSLDLSPRRDGLCNDVEAQQYLLGLMADYVRRGYFGKIVQSNHTHSDAYAEGRVEEVVFHLDNWEDYLGRRDFSDPCPEYPPTIELRWAKQLGSSPEQFERLLEALREHHLRQVPA